jgi:hypothetical protein
VSTVTDELVAVRVLPGRSLSLPDGRGGSVHFVTGDEVFLPAGDAAQLVDDGYVEQPKK